MRGTLPVTTQIGNPLFKNALIFGSQWRVCLKLPVSISSKTLNRLKARISKSNRGVGLLFKISQVTAQLFPKLAPGRKVQIGQQSSLFSVFHRQTHVDKSEKVLFMIRVRRTGGNCFPGDATILFKRFSTRGGQKINQLWSARPSIRPLELEPVKPACCSRLSLLRAVS